LSKTRKVISRKTKLLRFFGLPGMLTCIDTDTDIGTVTSFVNFILLVLLFCAFIVCKTMRLTVMISNETTYLLT